LPNCATNGRKYGQPYLGPPGNSRALRGGSWNNNQDNARAAYRNNNSPDNRNDNNGFRVVVVRVSTPYLLSPKGMAFPNVPLPWTFARSGLADR